MKKVLAILLAAVMLFALVGCGEKSDDNKKTDDTKSNDGKPVAQEVGTAYSDKEVGFQLEAPEKGETVAVMHTSMGDISIRFFPEAAPKAVENFLTHAKEGYYDGLTIHRVIENFMIQGGDPKGDGTGGESIWKKGFEDEFDTKLLNLRGSLSMANSGISTNGSQFFINQSGAESFNWASYDYDTMMNQYQQVFQYYTDTYGEQFTISFPTLDIFIEKYAGGLSPLSYTVPEEVVALYQKVGGNINLDGAWRASRGHTVFGQVYEGMDIVDAIAKVETDENDKPTTPVLINSIEVKIF